MSETMTRKSLCALQDIPFWIHRSVQEDILYRSITRPHPRIPFTHYRSLEIKPGMGVTSETSFFPQLSASFTGTRWDSKGQSP
jgi:hypothetical protein